MAPAVENVQQVDLSQLSAPASNSQAIDRGDVLSVTVATDYSRLPATSTPVRVGEDGFAEIPQIGRVSLAGLELEEAEAVITTAGVNRQVFRNPHVTVTMRRQRKNRITVIGAVEKASVVELPRKSSTLLAALVAAGGLAEDAGATVDIRRTGRPDGLRIPTGEEAPQVADNGAQLASYEAAQADAANGTRIIQVNLTETTPSNPSSNHLQDGDVVMVSRRTPKPIHVIGLVRKPDKYELPSNQEVRVLDALAMAGDRTMQAADKVIVIRQLENQHKPIRIEVSVREAKANGAANLRLAPGDIVSVEETPVTMVFSTLQQVVRIAVGGSVAVF
jgi:polysaccharide export outer membrane protein